jgi:hypothetical protein
MGISTVKLGRSALRPRVSPGSGGLGRPFDDVIDIPTAIEARAAAVVVLHAPDRLVTLRS